MSDSATAQSGVRGQGSEARVASPQLGADTRHAGPRAAVSAPRSVGWRLVASSAALLVVLGLVIVVSAAQGPTRVSFPSAAGVILSRAGLPAPPFTQTEQRIVEQIRLPRIVTGALVGLALGVAGAVLQGLFRNPLADPGVLGVSGGGALGAVLAIASGVAASYQLALPASALLGAMAAAFAVYAIASARGRTAAPTLILAGIAVSALTGALSAAVISFTEDRERNRQILFWLMGGLDNLSWDHARLIVIPIVLGTAVCLVFGRELNLMLLGEESARSLGVSVSTARGVLLVIVAALAGVAVAVSGIIHFVGLIVPHIVRLMVGYDHRLVVPLSGLAGAAFVVAADTLARVVIQPGELRVGIITSALGAPFFIYLIARGRRERQPV
jgi:iron complex transport system permease protein